MTIQSQPPSESSGKKHDQIYTALLGVCAFFMITAIGTLVSLRQRPGTDDKGMLMLPIFVESCYLAAMLVVLIIRIVAPRIRRWPTFALNIILLILFPFGTALAIYGLRKIDKNAP